MKHKKHLFVGDLHGDIEKFNVALQYAQEHDCVIVFLGDYSDSFDISRENQEKLLNLMINKFQRDKTIYLIGNHDIQYIISQNMTNPFLCHGYSSLYHWNVYSLYMKMMQQNMLQFFYRVGHVLATHAGLGSIPLQSLTNNKHKRLADYSLDEIEVLLNSEKENMFIQLLRANNRYPLFDVGISSGGYSAQGGILWLRPIEYISEQDVSKFYQFVGHTSVDDTNNAPRKEFGWYNESLCVLDVHDNTHFHFMEYNPNTNGYAAILLKR